MAKVLDDLYYSPSHEYVRVDGDFAYIGITDYAQEQLGNVVYVDMPEPGDELSAGSEFGAVESVKAVSDLMAPVSGVVEEVNEILDDEPERINADAFANWIVKIKLADPSELGKLMNAKDYEASLAD
ncbi:glycine cleavage system H protein [Prevotella sp. CAG:755]|nr:glycine cleavage system H protein [Prevotella sp. CAG:755]